MPLVIAGIIKHDGCSPFKVVREDSRPPAVTLE